MRILWIVTFLSFCALSAGATDFEGEDPIDHLVAELSADHGWTNGVFQAIKLPENAKPEDVVTSRLELDKTAAGLPKSYKVIEIRQVHITPFNGFYTAALVQTDIMLEIVILKFKGEQIGWWSHIYNSNEVFN